MLKKLRKDMIQAKKDRDSFKSGVLATLLAEATMIGKNDGNRETKDEEVLRYINKCVKNLNETITLKKESEKSFETESAEIVILETYLPKKMTHDELSDLIDEKIDSLPEKSMKMMGKVMGLLKATHDGLYDGKIASGMVKDKLSKFN